jgi:hypothetical protein
MQHTLSATWISFIYRSDFHAQSYIIELFNATIKPAISIQMSKLVARRVAIKPGIKSNTTAHLTGIIALIPVQ